MRPICPTSGHQSERQASQARHIWPAYLAKVRFPPRPAHQAPNAWGTGEAPGRYQAEQTFAPDNEQNLVTIDAIDALETEPRKFEPNPNRSFEVPDTVKLWGLDRCLHFFI